MEIVKDKITTKKLNEIAKATFGNLVKAVVDIERETMAIGGELHSDEEALLLENGSKQKNLWGINLYPEVKGSDWIEFDSMINLRPAHGNRSRGVDDPKMQESITRVVNKLVEK